jgi:hypothetical protein
VKKPVPSFIALGFLISLICLPILLHVYSSYAIPSHEGTVLQSSWTWDDPLYYNSDNVWDGCQVFSSFITDVGADYSSQKIELKFLNNDRYLFIRILWIDDFPFQVDSIGFYFDEDNDGVLNNTREDYKFIIGSSGGNPSISDGHWQDGWVTDANQSTSIIGSFNDFMEIKIPIGANADTDDLDGVSPGDRIGLGLIAQDTELFYNPNPTQITITTEIFGNETNSSNWADLQLASHPDLEFPVKLTTSKSVVSVGEAFYVLGFIANINRSSTGRVHNINATLVLPEGITFAPTVLGYQYLESLNSAASHASGYNHTFLWTVVAENSGNYSLEFLVDALGIPLITNTTRVTVFPLFPDIQLIQPTFGEQVSGITLFQFTINYQEDLVKADYSLDDQVSWIGLSYNPVTNYYETMIDNRTFKDHIYVRAMDNGSRMTVLDIQITNNIISSANITRNVLMYISPPDIALDSYSTTGDIIKVELLVSSPVTIIAVDYLLPGGIWLPTSLSIGVYSFQFQIFSISNNSIIKVRAIDENDHVSYLNLTIRYSEREVSQEQVLIITSNQETSVITSSSSTSSVSTTTTEPTATNGFSWILTWLAVFFLGDLIRKRSKK